MIRKQDFGLRFHSRLKSKYKYVTICQMQNGKVFYTAAIPIFKKHKSLNTEKEAAIMVDKWLIMAGKEPVNILVRKND